VVLELAPGAERKVEIGEGECFVVPRGVWHRLLFSRPVRLLYMTPGPNSEHRPLSSRSRAARV
jgi:mannose-6-phosphate isomerase-like protein (cupin superfamily)